MPDRPRLVAFSASLALAVMVVLVGAALSCGDHLIEPEPADFTEEVERICADNCEMHFACGEPPAFESYEECEQICLHLAYIYNDTVCGEATRGVYGCIGSQPTCELYLDTNNVHAEQYTCKAEKDHWISLSQSCGESDEDPFPNGEP
jgi:hypothetical protein